MKEHYYFVMHDYQAFFTNDSNIDWYAKTISSLIESATFYKKQKIIDDSIPISQKTFEEITKREIAPEFAIENQIGLILVLCQVYISNIVSRVEYFYKDFEFFSDAKAIEIPHAKQDLLIAFGKILNGSNYRDVQFIDALANYYKHHEEWGNSKNKQNERTKNILKYFELNTEMNIYWAQNMSNGIKILGIESVSDSISLVRIINSWKKEIGKAIPELNIELPIDWYRK